MAGQVTLFGRLAKKEPFFSASEVSEGTSSGSQYYSVVEALWALDNSGCRRYEFFRKAQDLWRTKYKDEEEEEERKALLERASSQAKKDQETTSARQFVKVLSADDLAARTVAPAATSSASTSEMPAKSGLPGPVSTPLDFLLKALKVDKMAFFTEDVKGKASVVQLLREVTEAYTAYEEERCIYERMSIQRRKR